MSNKMKEKYNHTNIAIKPCVGHSTGVRRLQKKKNQPRK